MKKFLFAFLVSIMFFGVANAATSDDVYLRKDVFDAKMDAFMAEIRLMNMGLRQEMDRRFNEADTKIKYEMQNLSENIKSLDRQTQHLQKVLYICLFFIFILLFMKYASYTITIREKSTSQLTHEEVKALKRLIEIEKNSASLTGK